MELSRGEAASAYSVRNRLYIQFCCCGFKVPKERPVTSNRRNPKMSQEAVEDMVDRLTRNAGEKASDQKRVPEGRLKDIGILNSFVWKGYNY